MRAIQCLCDEHQALRGVLDSLELVLECQRMDDLLPAEIALDVLEWLERFADGLHQDREEMGLFPRLAVRAPERSRGVLKALMSWHARERELLDEMRRQIEGAAYGDPLSRDWFTLAARAYVDLQRRHTDIEDAELLPLARAVLTSEDDELMLAEYEALERRYVRPGERTPWEAAGRLIVRAREWALQRQPCSSSGAVRVQRDWKRSAGRQADTVLAEASRAF